MHRCDEILKNAKITEGGKDRIIRAFELAKNANRNEADLVRATETAKTLALLGMDADAIAAGLLYNVLEKELADKEALRREFGEKIAFLVESVTELSKHRYQGLERHKESLRKLLLFVSEDIRVLIVKLAERLHRFDTLVEEPEDKQQRTALETLEIYAPIAERLRIGQVKGGLEDRAFPYVLPAEYEETLRLASRKRTETLKYIEKVRRALQKNLYKERITVFDVDCRMKHLYSLWKKLVRYDMDIEKIHDIAALRVILPAAGDCYRVLGIVHGTWEPLQGKVKDYIAKPKPNGYRSLHTTVRTGDGGVAEIQIRTERMHREAEFGIAAHFAYKEASSAPGRQTLLRTQWEWLKEIARWQRKQAEHGTGEFRVDFFRGRVFVFTPHGDVIDLPSGSTPIDFAYAIHSKIGDAMAGAKINGKLSALETELQNGDRVEIATRKDAAPSPKWLDAARTPLAKKHIKAALQKREQDSGAWTKIKS